MKFALFRGKNKNHAPKIFQMEKLGSLAVFDDFDSKTLFDYLRSIKCIQMIQMRQIFKNRSSTNLGRWFYGHDWSLLGYPLEIPL